MKIKLLLGWIALVTGVNLLRAELTVQQYREWKQSAKSGPAARTEKRELELYLLNLA